jgi:hypothetical protein
MSALRDREQARGLIIHAGCVDHAEALARDLRPADRLECEAYAGEPALAVVRESYRRSLWSWTAFGVRNSTGSDFVRNPTDCDFAPVCAWGVVPLSILGGQGQPWCLTTERMPVHKRLFARASRAWVVHMLADFPVLEGWMDGRHTAAARWLPWLGFRLDEPVLADGVPWRRFTMVRRA